MGVLRIRFICLHCVVFFLDGSVIVLLALKYFFVKIGISLDF
jgi:hypothetical protein